ncbi:MAG: hypothetical protein ACX939_03770 [Hyphococcus sp.]
MLMAEAIDFVFSILMAKSFIVACAALIILLVLTFFGGVRARFFEKSAVIDVEYEVIDQPGVSIGRSSPRSANKIRMTGAQASWAKSLEILRDAD